MKRTVTIIHTVSREGTIYSILFIKSIELMIFFVAIFISKHYPKAIIIWTTGPLICKEVVDQAGHIVDIHLAILVVVAAQEVVGRCIE